MSLPGSTYQQHAASIPGIKLPHSVFASSGVTFKPSCMNVSHLVKVLF
jgi:hypothetical protein